MALTVGELVAFLDLDANPFTKGLDRAFADAEKSGKRMSDIGGDMTRKVTLPIVAAGAAVTKLGADYDDAFARMVGLAGVPQAEVEGLQQSVLDLAGDTAVAPQQLADALYFAASAGLDAAGAMDAVTYAAKASAAGMGSAEQIVGLTASAVASYGAENINAARATDILTAAVRAGRADPEELAGTLGRVLPIASQLGVSFEEVGGTVAYLSNVFGDTNRTVTAISGLMVKLVSPTQQGRNALEEMGTSVEELQAAIQEDGLMGALDLLREKGFAGNQQALRALFDDIEGYQGALALLNDESGQLQGTLDEVAGSAGALDEAFEAASSTEGFAMRQAFVDLQVAAIEAGDVVVPFVATVLGGVADIASAFGSLPGPAQTVILTFAGVLAATGPLLSIGGKLLQNWQSISSGAETLALKGMYARDAIGGLGTIATPAAAAVGIFAIAMFDAKQRADEMAAAAKALADEAEQTGDTLEEVALRQMVEAFTGTEQTRDAMEALGVSFADLRGPLRGSREEYDAWLNALQEEHPGDARVEILARRVSEARGALGQARDATEATDQAVEDLGSGAVDAAPKVEGLSGALGGSEQAADEAKAAVEEFKAALDRAFAPLDRQAAEDAFTSSLQGIGDHFTEAADRVDDAQDRLDSAKGRLADLQATPEKDRGDDHARRVAEARKAIADAEADVAEAIDNTSRALEGNSAQAIANRERLDEAVRAAGDVLTAMKEQGASDEELAAKKDELLWRLALEADAYGLNQDQIRTYTDLIGAIPTTKSTELKVNAGGAFQTVREFMAFLDASGVEGTAVTGHTINLQFKQDQLLKAHTGGRVPGGRAEEVPMLLLGGETVRTVDQERALQQAFFGGGATTRQNTSRVGTGGVQIGEVHNHYPAPEPPSEGVGRAARKASALAG